MHIGVPTHIFRCCGWSPTTDVPRPLQPITVIINDLPVARHNGTTDIYIVQPTKLLPSTAPLAIKAPRLLPEMRDSSQARTMSRVIELFTRFCSNILGNHAHDNVYPFWVVNTSSTAGSPTYALAIPWCRNGNVLEYVRSQVVVNKFALVLQIAEGLAHLHSHGVVHGNICPNNILIFDGLGACITDVGLDLLMRRAYLDANGHLPVPSQWMFKSPGELSGANNATDGFDHTAAMDVYSFACTVYTIYSGNPPFSGRNFSYGRGLSEIRHHRHSRLQRPAEMSEAMWTLIMLCWKESKDRPTMEVVAAELQRYKLAE